MEFLLDASAVALAVFVPLAAVDGIYLHLWKFRLHARPESRREHALHTLHAVLFVFLLAYLYSGDTAGLPLWAGTAAALANLWIMAADIREERTSRRFQGGLPRLELRLHVVLIALQVLGTVLSLAARPAGAWALGAVPTAAQAAAAETARALALQGLLPGSVVLALLHVVLLVRGQRRTAARQPALVPAACC
jgi:hypothetical protein